MARKYKRLAKETITIGIGDGKTKEVIVRRIQALRDIPLHGVKAGDIGGYVSKRDNLSHSGECWIAGDAVVYKNVKVLNNALVKDKAIVIGVDDGVIRVENNVKIFDGAFLEASTKCKTNFSYLHVNGYAQIFGKAYIRLNAQKRNTFISDNVKIYGSARIFNPTMIEQNAVIAGESFIDNFCEISDSIVIKDSVYVGVEARLFGTAVLEGNIKIPRKSYINDKLPDFSTISEAISTFSPDPILTTSSNHSIPSRATSKYSRILEETKASIDSYQKDIIKLLKYPAMSDKTNAYTLDMFAALKEAEYADPNGDPEEYKDAVMSLTRAFMAAESNATKLSHSNLDQQAQENIITARKMFSIASNEASSETEKKNAFKQGFKKLEGIVAVPEIAVDEFRIKVGLPELEQL